MLSSRVGIDKKDEELRLNGKIVHKFGGLALGWVCKGTTGAGIAHTFDVGVHTRPVVLEANTVEGAVSVEVVADGI